MSLFGLFGGKKEREVALVVHAGSASVGGAYVLHQRGQPPAIYYAARVPIEPREGEQPADALGRALDALCAMLAREGGPALLRGTGDAHASRVIAYVGTPWEETDVHAESIEPGKEFTVTRATRARALAHALAGRSAGKRTEDEVIATRLNGYETHAPFGKRASRAEFVIVSSSLDEDVARAIERSLRLALHRQPALSAFLPAAYRGIRSLYPHEKDYFIIDAGGEATSIALIERGVLADARTVPHGTRELASAALKAGIHAAQAGGSAAFALVDDGRNQRFGASLDEVRTRWRDGISDGLKSFAATRALPRTLFVLADADSRAYLKAMLSGPDFNSLWLTDEPPRVIALAEGNMSAAQVRGEASGDLYLMLLALADEPAADAAE